MGVSEDALSRTPADTGEDTVPDGSSEELYTPVEAAIDREAEKTVCSECKPASRNPIVSVNGRDVDESSLRDGREKAA